MILAVCVFVLANLCAGRLTEYFGLTLDFTGERLYSLSDATKTALSQLRTETSIYIISEEKSYPTVLREIIARYAKFSPALNVRYIDPYADPVFLDSFQRRGFSLRESDILVEGINGARHIQAAQIFITGNNGNPSGLTLEEKLTNALISANTGRELSLAFIAGHGESQAASLEEAFSGGGFSVQPLTLLTGAIPRADVTVIAGPERDFLPEEIAALDNYLDNGGALMVFIGPLSAKLPNLEKLLSKWGLLVSPDIAQEPLAHTPGNPASLIPLYGMHRINIDFTERQYYLAMPAARVLKPATDSAGIAITRLLLSSRDAYLKNGTGDEEATESGPFVLAAVSEKREGNTGAEKNGVVMVFGSTGIFSADIIAAPAFANREYLVNAALWLAGNDTQQTVSIPPKTIAPPSINAGFEITLMTLLIFGIILPLTVISYGAVRLRRRRGR